VCGVVGGLAKWIVPDASRSTSRNFPFDTGQADRGYEVPKAHSARFKPDVSKPRSSGCSLPSRSMPRASTEYGFQLQENAQQNFGEQTEHSRKGNPSLEVTRLHLHKARTLNASRNDSKPWQSRSFLKPHLISPTPLQNKPIRGFNKRLSPCAACSSFTFAVARDRQSRAQGGPIATELTGLIR